MYLNFTSFNCIILAFLTNTSSKDILKDVIQSIIKISKQHT